MSLTENLDLLPNRWWSQLYHGDDELEFVTHSDVSDAFSYYMLRFARQEFHKFMKDHKTYELHFQNNRIRSLAIINYLTMMTLKMYREGLLLSPFAYTEIKKLNDRAEADFIKIRK